MKKLIIMSALVMGGLGLNTASAQFGIRVNLNLGSHPVYVPAPQPQVVEEPVYDNDDDDYFYLPEVEAYYNVHAHMYFYNDGNRWISAAYLPGRFRDFDWRSARRYEIHARNPYMRHDAYRGKFGGYRDRNDYYARAYPNRGGFDQNRGREQYDNRGGWNNQNDNRGGYDRRDGRNQNNGYQDRNQGSYSQPNQPQQNQGGYSQPSQNRGGQGRNQGGNNQPGQNQGGQQQQQPSQGQGGRGNGGLQGQGNGNSQPSNQNGGQRGGNYNGGEHFTANKIGIAPDRQDFGRPVRP